MTTQVEPQANPDHRPAPPDIAGNAAPVRLFAVIVLTILLLVLCALLAVPFLPAITWAVALAILAWPVHRWICRRVPRRGIAAALSSTVVVITILASGAFVTYQIASETASAVKQVEDGGTGNIRKQAEAIPILGWALGWMERVGLSVETAARGLVEANVKSSSDLAQGSAMAVIQFLLAVFILYFMFRDRDTFLDGLRDLLPLSEGESDFLITRAADSVHATLYATIITSVIDSLAFGLTFWAVGVPAPVLWAVIMLILSLLPVLGAALIWVPALAYLAMSGKWIGVSALLVVGLVTATFVDNILYARLAGGRMQMHAVPVLVAFLGGLAVFGMSGMVLGPAILAVTEAILEVWRRRLTGTQGFPLILEPGGVSGLTNAHNPSLGAAE